MSISILTGYRIMATTAIKNILAAIDVSDADLPALRYARLFSERFSAKLVIVYSDPIAFPADFAGPVDAFYASVTPEHQARLQKEVEDHVMPLLDGYPHEVLTSVGRPTHAILRTAEDIKADLIVTGAHRRRGWIRALLGSVSDGVLHGARCPVLVAGAQDSRIGSGGVAVTNVLCPINFTEAARESLRVAARLAESFGAGLTVVHVIEPGVVADQAADAERLQNWIDPELRDVCAYRQLVLRGGPAERVLDCADDIGSDLLVIGAQHKVFRDATVIGTTTERLIRFASSPVLVVPLQAVRKEQVTPIEGELVNA